MLVMTAKMTVRSVVERYRKRVVQFTDRVGEKLDFPVLDRSAVRAQSVAVAAANR